MFCQHCGTQLPDSAKFCFGCGQAVGGGSPAASAAAAPTSSSPTLAPAGVQALKCPSCGAPITPTFGDMVVSCEYCGATVSLGGAGWKGVSKHSMLVAKLLNAADALKVVHDSVDRGLFHRHAFEESTITEQKLSFVPFWVIPTAATTNYQYQDMAVGVGGTVATVAASAALGSVLSGGGRRGGFAVIPVMAAPPVNPTRSDTLSANYEYPVVAVKGLSAYQPKGYEFALADRAMFDKKQIPAGTPVLNGDLGEDAAQHAARSYVSQLQGELAHKKHYMVSNLQTSIEVSEGELLHVPIWYFVLDRKGQHSTVLIDGHSAQIMTTIGP